MAFRDDGGHADLIAEVRHAIIAQAQRQARYHDAGRANDLPAQVVAPLNALAASVEPGFEAALATAYDSVGGVTLVPFIWGLTAWNGGDVWSGS